jgi:uncharacterized RmlC-like cupin family protein
MVKTKRALARLLGVVIAMITMLLVAASPAQAADVDFLEASEVHYLNQCGKFWPSTGVFRTTELTGSYIATLHFKLTQAEKNALACIDPYLELDFHIRGFNVSGEWDDYTVNTDIPGAVHDSARDDDAGNEGTPGLTNIRVSSIVPNRDYYATITFSLSPSSDPKGPRVSFEWVPSYWASLPQEVAFCNIFLVFYGPSMCVFPKTRAYLSHGYLNNTSLVFNGYHELSFSPSTPTSSSPPSSDLSTPAVVQNYKADRTVLHAPSGSLYIMAGGAKFYIGSMGEFTSLGYSTAGMVYLSDQALAAIPSVPRDGTILHGGGGQIYAVAGGAKFYFGSMTEYYGQGYSNGQMINVPQGPLDAIGDAPGNRPSDGAILRHPDGRLFVMSGGVKFYFGSMTEFSSLGYSASRITPVSGGSLDAIPTASTVSPPRDRTILRSGGGQIYVVAGGAKFYYGSMTEYLALGGQETDWVNVPQGSLDAIGDAPGNVPRDKTVLRSGGGQIYVMAGGAKFYFGSMTEYHAQGYVDSQMITVPQGPLDLVGDAPGNMPRNGTVVQRPDESLYVITGGVRWGFGSMSEYYQLGYTDAQMVRVSTAPLNGVFDASASHLPGNETLLQGTDGTVWVMKSGQRRAFTGAQQFVDLGYLWANITRVPSSLLAGIPNGGTLS